jgi:hypothetical protein
MVTATASPFMVGPDYFPVMGTRILTGRGITELDGPDAAQV